MAQTQLSVETVLTAAREHIAGRSVCTFATSHDDVPWAASAFYIARDLDIFTCQRKAEAWLPISPIQTILWCWSTSPRLPSWTGMRASFRGST